MIFVPAVEPANITSPACYVAISAEQLLCSRGGVWRPLSHAQFSVSSFGVLSQHFLGYVDGAPCWVIDVDPKDCGPSWEWVTLRSQLGLIDENSFLLAGRALQVLQWHKDHQFCGRCGRATTANKTERSKVCGHCKLHFYPRLSPCVIMLVTRGRECLLARHARSKNNLYTALAGFVEVGESLEDTIHREIMEEVGVRVCSLRYFRSQPWPFPGQLMIGFHVEYAEGDIRVDGEEILDARWYSYDRLPQVPSIATLSGQLIADFVSHQ